MMLQENFSKIMNMKNDNSDSSSLKPTVESLAPQVSEFYYDPESNRVFLKSQGGRDCTSDSYTYLFKLIGLLYKHDIVCSR